MKASGWAADLVDLLLPGGCVACGAWIPTKARDTALVCDRCQSRFSVAPWPRCPRCHFPRGAGRPDAHGCIECRAWAPELTEARYAFVLRAPVEDLVHALKYEAWPELAAPMGREMAKVARALTTPVDAVVPVPTTPKRVKQRGYNQAALLATTVAESLGRPLQHALVRHSAGRSQTTLTPNERRENVRGAFSPDASAAARLEGQSVLLVDDVLTTGATASEAATTLASMGASRVTLLTFARALP